MPFVVEDFNVVCDDRRSASYRFGEMTLALLFAALVLTVSSILGAHESGSFKLALHRTAVLQGACQQQGSGVAQGNKKSSQSKASVPTSGTQQGSVKSQSVSLIEPQTVLALIGATWGSMLLGIFYMGHVSKKPVQRKDSEGHLVADYSIPHCNFHQTADGFSVTFRRIPRWFNSFDAGNPSHHRLAQNPRTPSSIGAISIISRIVPMFFAVPVAFFLMLLRPFRITVTKDSIVIGTSKLRRSDFGGFFIANTVADSALTGRRNGERVANVMLEYRYGNRNFSWGGMWPEDKAIEFLDAFNAHLQGRPTGQGAYA